MSLSFSIVIVSWNGLQHLKQFLPSVAATDYSDFEIIIADNHSTDGTAEWVRNAFPECRIVTFDSNYGYCGGNNRAVPYTSGEILIFLNNDAGVDPAWLTPLNEMFMNEPETAIVQPKILSHKSPNQFEYAGAAGGMIDRLGYTFCRGRLFDEVEEDRGQYDDRATIFWASGAAFAIRKDLFRMLGGFDEEFEFHMEEIDLCWRAWNRGYRTRFQHESIVYHLGGGSLPMGSPRKVYYNYRNSLLMLTKNLQSNVFGKIFLRLCLDGVAGLKSFAGGKPRETFAIIRAHFAFYRRVLSALKKRDRFLTRDPEIDPPVHPRLIIIDFFIRRLKTYHELHLDEKS